MRKLLIASLLASSLLAAPATAHAELGIGLFLGEPTGLDVKIGLQRRSALDIVLGWNTYRDGRASYGHLTYLYQIASGRGNNLRVPLRIGIGGAVYGHENDINVGVRAPLELGLRFTRTPVEIYGEIAVLVTFLDDNGNHDDIDLQGGVGLRFYF